MRVSGLTRGALGITTCVAILLAACGGGGESFTDRLVLIRAEGMGGNNGIVEISLATGEEELLIPDPPESFLLEPAVSPDGSQIAYVRDLRPFVDPDQPQDFGMDLYLAEADGSNPRLIQEHQQLNEKIRSPVWLPDGQSLLVVVERVQGTQVSRAIERVDLATGERTLVIEDGFRPAVSPDGSRIVYVTQDEELVQTLWTANIDGTGSTELAGPDDGLGSFISPRFSPDGALLAFAASPPGGTGAQSRADPGTGAAPRLASRAPAHRTTAADPAFAYNGLPMDIWLMEMPEGSPRVIAELSLDLPSLAWSGDGSHLFVLAGRGLFAVDPIDESDKRVADGTFHGQVDWLAPE